MRLFSSLWRRGWRSLPGRYVLNLLISIDQLANTLLAGDPDETLSSVAAKHSHALGWRQLGLILEAIDPGHLKRAIELDEGGRSLW
ncbi:MAG: hypothetical protein IE919_09960 [Thioclava sp.]|nr:hypothetical protein [Thioclava sp.]MBD3803548.1 hypothetical protein [Thioclava sp.]